MKLGLGTVQFGMPYGVSNKNGKPMAAEVGRILDLAAVHDITLLDTAPLYGESESVLGAFLSRPNSFRVVTKTCSLPKDRIAAEDIRRLRTTFDDSTAKLGVKPLYGLLVHQPDAFFADNARELVDCLRELKSRGLVQKIGVSVYAGEQIDRILDTMSLDLVQLPFNVFDQRLAASGHLKHLKRAGIEIHARSVFLQGILLMKPEEIPSSLEKLKPRLRDLRQEAEREGLSVLQVALGFALGTPEIDRVLVGVTSRSELQDILSASAAIGVKSGQLIGIASKYAVDDEILLNPSLWTK